VKTKRRAISLNGSKASESVCVKQLKVANTVQTIPHQLTFPPLPVSFSHQPLTAGRSAIAVDMSGTELLELFRWQVTGAVQLLE